MERTRLRASLEELVRFGCPVDVSVSLPETQSQAIEIDQVGGVIESQFFRLANRRLACLAHITITNLRTRPLDIAEVYLRTPWDEDDLQWLQPVEIKCGKGSRQSVLIYKFDSGGPEFSYNEVLNHHLTERKRLPGKRCLEGMILAVGGFMPENIPLGQFHELTLHIIGSDHESYSDSLSLWVDRTSEVTRKMPVPCPNLMDVVSTEHVVASSVGKSGTVEKRRST